MKPSKSCILKVCLQIHLRPAKMLQWVCMFSAIMMFCWLITMNFLLSPIYVHLHLPWSLRRSYSWSSFTFLCLLMRWTDETARHAREQPTLPSVTQELPVPCSLLIDLAIPPWYCSPTHNVHQRRVTGVGKSHVQTVNITFRAYETCCILQFDNNFKHRSYSTWRA